MIQKADVWKRITISDCVELINGYAFSSEGFTDTEGIPLIRIRDLENHKTEINYQGKYNDRYIVRKDDLLIGMDGDFLTVKWKGMVSLLNQRVCKLITKNPNKLAQDFLFYRIIEEIGRIHRITAATTVKHLSSKDVLEINIDLPPTTEQSKIAEILSTVDQAIEQTEALIAKQQRIKIGMMQDLLTRGIDEHGNIRSEKTHEFKDSSLGRIPVEWDVGSLGELVKIKHGYAFKGEFFSDQPNSNILLTPGNFQVKGGLYFTKDNTKYYYGPIPEEFVLSNGDVLVVMTDLTKEMAILGRTVILNHPDKVLHNQRIGKVIINQGIGSHAEFIAQLMNSNLFRELIKATATGTTVRHTSPEKLLSPLVPIIKFDEQKKIYLKIDVIDEQIRVLSNEFDKMKRIKTALMQDLLTGKKRVTPLLEDLEEVMDG